MESHVCSFSIVRLGSHYKGTAYEINECEECGALGMFASEGPERRVVARESSEFEEIVDLIEFLMRALQK
jgi:hypothetical protein